MPPALALPMLESALNYLMHPSFPLLHCRAGSAQPSLQGPFRENSLKLRSLALVLPRSWEMPLLKYSSVSLLLVE